MGTIRILRLISENFNDQQEGEKYHTKFKTKADMDDIIW